MNQEHSRFITINPIDPRIREVFVRRMQRFWETRFYRRFKRRALEIANNTYVQIFTGILLCVHIGGLLISFFEDTSANQASTAIRTWYEGIWWAFVTVFTIGYGDYFPITTGGRFLAVMIMVSGVALISLLTATISSAFVEQRIRKGQGLEKVKLKGHVVICGWNFNVESIIKTLEAELDYPSIVLVNSCDPSPIGEIINAHTNSEISFVAGDFSKDAILDKANIRHAECVIVVADSNELTSNKADEKTIITVLTVKNMNPKIRVFAHVINPDNAPHLRRAKADDIVISDKYSGFLLAMHVTNPGVPRLFDELLSIEGNEIVRLPIPDTFIGKPFWELTNHYKDKNDCMLIGIAQETRSIAMDDLLSDDNSYLDQFIRAKLQESGKRFAEEERVKIKLNPSKDLVIENNMVAVVLGNKF